MIIAGLTGALVTLIVVVFLIGRKAGRNSVFWQIENDDPFRRQVLEQVAKLEGCRIVGRE